MEGAWSIIEEEIKKGPGLALSWINRVHKPDQDKGPMHFQVGSAKNFKQLGKVMHLNKQYIYIVNKHLVKEDKNSKIYNPHKRN